METFTVKQVAQILQTKEEQVLASIASGDLAASNIGAGRLRPRWRITDSDLGRFLLARRHPANSQAGPTRHQSRQKGKQYV